jgi:ABC-2 type transport system permease protein
VLAALVWGRGLSRGLRERLRMVPLRLTRATALVAAVAALVTLSVGGFVFYNTNVRNAYRNSRDAVRSQAEYERRYGAFAGAAQPQVASTTLRIEIHPRLGTADIAGTHVLVNRSDVAIDSLHVAPALGVTTGPMDLDRAATLVVDDSLRAHRIYVLAEPLQPGDSLRLHFTVRAERRGFKESGASDAIVPNGTQFTSAWLPAIGYQRSRELASFGARRKEGLRAKPVIPSLYDESERRKHFGGRLLDVVVATDAGQVAVAPGALRRSWEEQGRAYFHYVTDAPVGDEYAFFSAAYAVREDRWEDSTQPGRSVAIRIHHHPTHGAQIDRMLRSIRASLDHYTQEFGPYRFGHLTFVEHAGNGTGMHADASEISFSEGSALLTPRDDSTRLDLPFGVVAHEMAHQWNVPSAYVEGAPVMSESLAWFYAMQVLERTYGEAGRRRLLAFMRQPYPYQPIRRGEPLLRGLDPYISYRKGPYALHALSEYVGDAPINLALRRLTEAHQPEGSPLATTRDLYREIQRVTPDSLQYLAHDWFEVNTFWEFEARRVSAVELPSGEWRVTMALRARKTVADSAGVETELPMDEWVELGIFAPVDGGDHFADPLYRRRHRIRSGVQNITVVVARKPALAGIDPFHVLDVEEKEVDNNIARVRDGQ